jgi:hypothetical protein
MPLAGAAVPLDPASYPARGAELKLRATENAVRAEFAQSPAVRGVRLAAIPPLRQRALRVNVDQDDWTVAAYLSLDGQVGTDGRLSRPTFLGRHHQDVHAASTLTQIRTHALAPTEHHVLGAGTSRSEDDRLI